jgi:hypothetical protein
MKPSNRNTRKTAKAALLAAGLCAAAALGAVWAQTPESETPAPTLNDVLAMPDAKTNVKLRENSYYYNAFNRRDPFRSLVDGAFIRDEKMALVNLNAVTLVGIVKGELDRFALLEDEKGFSYILRVGDSVRNGSVVSIGDQEMVARVTNFGQTSTIRLHLIQRDKGEKR